MTNFLFLSASTPHTSSQLGVSGQYTKDLICLPFRTFHCTIFLVWIDMTMRSSAVNSEVIGGDSLGVESCTAYTCCCLPWATITIPLYRDETF